MSDTTLNFELFLWVSVPGSLHHVVTMPVHTYVKYTIRGAHTNPCIGLIQMQHEPKNGQISPSVTMTQTGETLTFNIRASI